MTSVYTAYAEITGIGEQQAGPPAKINMTVNYLICQTTLNKLQLTDSTGGYRGQVAAVVTCPATQAQVRAAAESAVQAAETDYPLLVFLWVTDP
jgi:hypothetical protein